MSKLTLSTLQKRDEAVASVELLNLISGGTDCPPDNCGPGNGYYYSQWDGVWTNESGHPLSNQYVDANNGGPLTQAGYWLVNTLYDWLND
ncbi:MAG: hypothetical protein ACPG41_09550 [Lacinutrix venerupis]